MPLVVTVPQGTQHFLVLLTIVNLFPSAISQQGPSQSDLQYSDKLS